MKYLIILLPFVALCYSVPIATGRNKHITLNGDTITIEGSQGEKVVISRAQESSGQRNVEVFMEDQTGPVRRTWFKDQGNMEDIKFGSQEAMTEVDILVEIFKKYQGVVHENVFEDILEEIRQFVRTGQVDVNVLNILTSFDCDQGREDCSFGMKKSLNTKTLQKLLGLLQVLGLSQNTIDIDRLVRKDPMFINKLTQQEPMVAINKEDLMYLIRLSRNEQERMGVTKYRKPVWMREGDQGLQNGIAMMQHRRNMPVDFDTVEQEQISMNMEQDQMIQKELMNMQLQKLMQDPRFQHMLMKPKSMMADNKMQQNSEGNGVDMDDISSNFMTPEMEKYMMMKEMDPEMYGQNIAAERLARLIDQMEEEEMFQDDIRDRVANQQGNLRHGHNIFMTPRGHSESQKDRMIKKIMMNRMMPMMQ